MQYRHLYLARILQSLGKSFIKLQRIKIFERVKKIKLNTQNNLQNTTIDLSSNTFRAHTLILLASFFIYFVELLPII